jgi:hypothetical protein
MSNEAENPPKIAALTVACNHCGAPLGVAADTRFVTCAHCGAKLEVHRTGGSLYTQVLEAIDQRTARMEQDLDVIRRQNEVERLDREWMMRREQFLARNEDGSTSPPSAIGGVIGAIVAVIFGIIWIGGAASAGAPAPFVGFGVLVVIIALVSAIVGIGKSASYQDQERAYQQQREQLLRANSPQQTQDQNNRSA